MNLDYITCAACNRNRLATMPVCRCGSSLIKRYGLTEKAPDHPKPKPKRAKLQPSPAAATKTATGTGEFITSMFHKDSDSQESEA